MNYKEEFETARKAWPGIKRGLETELKCLKKHKDWQKAILLLMPAIKEQIRRHELKKQLDVFVPSWKNFKTWLNNRCWEEEEELAISKPNQQSVKEEVEKLKSRDREMQEGWLRDKTTKALQDLRRDKSAHVANWLIDEILNERNKQTKGLNK